MQLLKRSDGECKCEDAEVLARSRRVVVVGLPGSGKSTFAASHAARIDADCVELDALFWQEGWEPGDPACFLAVVDALTDADGSWVVDGDFPGVRPLVWPRADVVVWIDVTVQRCVLRIAKRSVRRMVRRELLWGKVREDLPAVLGRESLLWEVMRHGRARRVRIRQELLHSSSTIVVIGGPRRRRVRPGEEARRVA